MEDELDPTGSSSETELDNGGNDGGESTQPENPPRRSAEDRINQLLAKTKELETKLREREEREVTPTPLTPPQQPVVTPEVKQAIEFLKSTGKFVDQEELDRRERVLNERLKLDSLHGSHERTLSGSDGRPKYDRSAVEEYMRKHGIYGDPMIAYNEMHRDELLDWELKQAESKRKSKPNTVLSPGGGTGGTNQNNQITREVIAEWLKTPEGRIKYEQNRGKILDLLSKGQL